MKLKAACSNGLTSLFIHYEGWSENYDEIIQLNDQRLAPLGFYTNRRDILKYILDGSGECKSGYVVPGDSEDYEKYSKLLKELNEESNNEDIISSSDEEIHNN